LYINVMFVIFLLQSPLRRKCPTNFKTTFRLVRALGLELGLGFRVRARARARARSGGRGEWGVRDVDIDVDIACTDLQRSPSGTSLTNETKTSVVTGKLRCFSMDKVMNDRERSTAFCLLSLSFSLSPCPVIFL
jgi:hypothetical protein